MKIKYFLLLVVVFILKKKQRENRIKNFFFFWKEAILHQQLNNNDKNSFGKTQIFEFEMFVFFFDRDHITLHCSKHIIDHRYEQK